MKAIVSVNGEVRRVEIPDAEVITVDHKHRIVDYFADPLPMPNPETHKMVDLGNVVTFGDDGIPVSVKRTYAVRELTADEKDDSDLGARIETLRQAIDALDAGTLNARQTQQALAHLARIVVKLWRNR